jgi:lipoprotein-releasing system permease protein
MGFSLDLALRYMGSKKRAFVSVGTIFAIIGVALGVAALATVMSVTGGFRAQFRQKVLGVNAHVLILKYSSDFSEYRDIMKQMEDVPGVTGIAPFVINPMMVTHAEHTATGVLLKGVDPALVSSVLDLPKHIVEGSLDKLRLPGAKPPERRRASLLDYSTRSSTGKGRPDAAQRPTKSFNAQLKEMIEAAESADAARGGGRADAGTGLGSAAGRDAGPDDEPLDLDADGLLPAGPIAPDGGFEVPLPSDEEEAASLSWLDPDPCQNPGSDVKLPGIVVGSTLARNLHVKLGGCVQVTSPTIGYTFSRGAIRAPVAKQFRVVAVFDAGFDQYDSKLVYTDLYEAQAFYDSGDTVTGVEMKVSDIDRARAIKHDINQRLSGGLYHTMDWEELNHGLFTALRIQQILMSLVLALIIVVAAFTVIATLIMVVLDKKREIAVLKAMGATNWALLRTFVYQGTIIGVVGTAIGLVLGILVCKGLLVYGFPLDPKVYFISQLPVQVRPSEFALVGVFSVLTCMFATVWPAMYAASLRPAEGFRDQ